MGGFGSGNFNNPAAAAALLSGFNPAAFAGFNPMGMSPGFGFNSMGFGGFGPGFFSGFGGFGPGGFASSGGGIGGSATGGGSGYGSDGMSGYGGGGRGHASSSSYDKDGYSDATYGMAEMKGSSGSDRNPSAGLPGSSAMSGNSSTGYDGIDNPMTAAYGHGALPGGFGGFPSIGDWSQFASAAGSGTGVGRGSDYQIGNYNQINSNYGPAGRLNSRGGGVGDKSNRGYRPY